MKRYMKSRCKCTVCDLKFSTRRGLQSHYLVCHVGIPRQKKERRNESYQRLEVKDNTNEA